jgi:hypothetical protein
MYADGTIVQYQAENNTEYGVHNAGGWLSFSNTQETRISAIARAMKEPRQQWVIADGPSVLSASSWFRQMRKDVF